MTSNVTRNYRRITPQPQPNFLVLQTLGQATGDLLPIRQHQHLSHGGHPAPPNYQDQMLRLVEARVHSGQNMVIFIHEPIHELLHTITGNAHFGDYGAL
jgi:hypothetical protein